MSDAMRPPPFPPEVLAQMSRESRPPEEIAEEIREAQDGPPESRDLHEREGAATKVPCPLCAGRGMVDPVVAAECARLRGEK